MPFLTSLLASIIRPIIQDAIAQGIEQINKSLGRLQNYEKFDAEAIELISLAEKATTTEEVKAHVRLLKEKRARLHS